MILGSLGDFAALGFAAQSLATPVGGFTMVANLFLQSFLQGENRLQRRRGNVCNRSRCRCCCSIWRQKRKRVHAYVPSRSLPDVAFSDLRWRDSCTVANPIHHHEETYQDEGQVQKLSPQEPYWKWRRLHPIFPSALSELPGLSPFFLLNVLQSLSKSLSRVSTSSRPGDIPHHSLHVCMRVHSAPLSRRWAKRLRCNFNCASFSVFFHYVRHCCRRGVL